MDLQSNLIESKKRRQSGGWQASLSALVLHGLLIGGIIVAGATATHHIDAEDKPIRAFVTEGAAPPPPPPPPPPPAASSSAPKATPHVVKIEQPKPVPHDAFIPPRVIPKDIPKVEIPQTTKTADVKPSENDQSSSAPAPAVDNGVPGGVVGGVQGGEVGGVVGGEVGGVKGGELGGVKGGVIGGTVGGQVGGTGTGTEGKGTGGADAPVEKPEPPSGPMRVGGDVKAPTVTNRVEPKYTETARTARVSGVVIVEAIIDKNGNVDQVRVIKGLPMGLSEEAERAVKQWKFRPGTMNGEPVDVIFNLTVNFQLGS